MNKKDILNKVKRIRDEHYIFGAAIDPVKIANDENIDVYEIDNLNADGKKVSGAIRIKDSKVEIYINAQDNNERKRFTIAHELGHYFLKHLDEGKEKVDLHRDTNSNSCKEEKEADEFAGCLLMDIDEVKNRFEKCQSIGLTIESTISWLASIFAVSEPAMYVRLKNLELI